MKKIIAAIIASLFIVAPVSAIDENTVYIRNVDGKVVYEAPDGFDERFMVHENMTPGGETYTDYLVVKNDTSKKYEIFFKISAEDNTPKAEVLIDHIEMRIFIDDNLFYDGKARGLDYRGKGINLTDAVSLGDFPSGRSIRMRIETNLDATYEDIENPDTSKTHWHFYVTDAEPEPDPDEPVEPEPVPPAPKTGDDFTPWLFVLLGASIVFFIFITIREHYADSKRDRK